MKNVPRGRKHCAKENARTVARYQPKLYYIIGQKYNRTADFVVIKGPKEGGHLGFTRDVLLTITSQMFERETEEIIKIVREYEEEFQRKIAIIVAGGIYDYEDISRAMSMGADCLKICCDGRM